MTGTEESNQVKPLDSHEKQENHIVTAKTIGGARRNNWWAPQEQVGEQEDV